jgi:uncharacterized protein (UPF0332 family)
MSIGNKEDYIRYRLEKSKESFADAQLLAENKRWNACINRLYYASFYAIIALLHKNNIKVQTHDGVRNQFGLHFIKNGLLEKEHGKLYTKLYDWRQKGDYGDLFDFSEELVIPLFRKIEELIIAIEKEIQK